MGALRPGAGHPVKRREDTVDTEEVRFCWKQSHMHTLTQLGKLDTHKDIYNHVQITFQLK